MNRFSQWMRKESWTAGGLLLILVFTGLVRYRLIDIPLERDEGEYAYAGQLILQGVPPYQAVYNMKFPGIYAAYALILAIGGQNYQSIHFALLVINLLTTLLVFLLARRMLGPRGGLCAAGSFALLSTSQSVLGVFANAEHFVILFAAAGLLATLLGIERKSCRLLFGAGILLGLSTLMKQHGALFGVLALLYIYWDWRRESPMAWRRLVLRLLSFAAGTATVAGFTLLMMAWRGVLGPFWFWTVEYARAYVSQMPLQYAWRNFISTARPLVHFSPLLWMLAGAGLLLLASRQLPTRHRIFLALFTLVSLLAICPGLYFREHYYLLLLPCTSLLIGTAIDAFEMALARRSPPQIQYGIPALLIAVAFCLPIYLERDFWFRMTPLQASRSIYGLNPFPESLAIADYIQKHTAPEDSVAILGSEPQIYFYAQRRSASGYIYMYPLMENHEFALQMQKNFIRDIELKHPRYVLFVDVPASWLKQNNSHMEIFQWFDQYSNREKTRLAGVVELYKDRAVYHWDSQVVWPAHSPLWIAIFERLN